MDTNNSCPCLPGPGGFVEAERQGEVFPPSKCHSVTLYQSVREGGRYLVNSIDFIVKNFYPNANLRFMLVLKHCLKDYFLARKSFWAWNLSSMNMILMQGFLFLKLFAFPGKHLQTSGTFGTFYFKICLPLAMQISAN